MENKEIFTVLIFSFWLLLGGFFAFALFSKKSAGRDLIIKVELKDLIAFFIIVVFALWLSVFLVQTLKLPDIEKVFVSETVKNSFVALAIVCLVHFLTVKTTVFNLKKFEGTLVFFKGFFALLMLMPFLLIIAGSWKLLLERFGFEAGRQNIVEIFSQIQNPYTLCLGVFVVVILAPIAEELVFRFFIYGALKNRLNKYFSALIVAILFGAIHETLFAFLPICILSLFFTYLYEKFGDIRAAFGAHIAFNFFNALLIFYGDKFLVQ